MHRIHAVPRKSASYITDHITYAVYLFINVAQAQYKESSIYLTKYRMSLNAALSLIRTWVQNALEQCVQQAKQQSDEGALSAGMHYIIFVNDMIINNLRFVSSTKKQVNVTASLCSTESFGCTPTRWSSSWPISNGDVKQAPSKLNPLPL